MGDGCWVLGVGLKEKGTCMIKSFRDLEVWQYGIRLVKKIYLVTAKFPKEETYGLMSQMRRSAVSIPSNIAEGKGRQTRNEYIRFLYIASGSIAELETQIVIAKELSYIDIKMEEELIKEYLNPVTKMIKKLINSLQNNPEPTTQNPQPTTPNPKPKTQNPKPKTQNPKPKE
jgi:four helix bundle protein